MAKQEATNDEQRGATMLTHLMIIGFSIITFCMMFTDQLEISSSAYEGIGSWKDVLFGEYNALPSFFGYLIYGIIAIAAFFPMFRESDHKSSLTLNIILSILATVGFILIAIITPIYKGNSAAFLCEGNQFCIDSFKQEATYSLKGGPISALVFGAFTTALEYYCIYSDSLKIQENRYKSQSKNKNLKQN